MMNERFENESLEHLCRRRLDYLQTHLSGTISAIINLELLDCDEVHHQFVMQGTPAPWMTNFHGTLHGGLCATFVDQAMGHMAFCLKPGPGTCPTLDMDLKYHRPLAVDDKILMRVRLVSKTRNLIHMACEAYRASAPDKLCISATATYFYKPDGKHL